MKLSHLVLFCAYTMTLPLLRASPIPVRSGDEVGDVNSIGSPGVSSSSLHSHDPIRGSPVETLPTTVHSTASHSTIFSPERAPPSGSVESDISPKSPTAGWEKQDWSHEYNSPTSPGGIVVDDVPLLSEERMERFGDYSSVPRVVHHGIVIGQDSARMVQLRDRDGHRLELDEAGLPLGYKVSLGLKD
jgi:hypothetical protein